MASHSAYRSPRAAVAAALAVPIVALTSAATLAPPAGARALHEKAVHPKLHGHPATLHGGASHADRLTSFERQVALPSSSIYAINWDPGHLFGGSWPQVIGADLHSAGVESVSSIPAFAVGGLYLDAGGKTASVTHAAKVYGPAPSGSASTSSTPQGGEAGKGVKKGAGKTMPRPIIRALALTSSLQSALKKGLLVQYSVNQQVAGYFELLLASGMAKRLHIHGQQAKWLPKGSKGETVLSYRLLVTTRKAHGRVRIVIPASAVKHLRKLHHVELMLRLVLRNAAPRRPKIADLQSTVTLKRPQAIHAIRASER